MVNGESPEYGEVLSEVCEDRRDGKGGRGLSVLIVEARVQIWGRDQLLETEGQRWRGDDGFRFTEQQRWKQSAWIGGTALIP